MPSAHSPSKISVLYALIAGLILVGLGGYYAFRNGIFASTEDADTIKNITVAFNNFPEGDISTQTLYSLLVQKITPDKAGYRCTEKVIPVTIKNADSTRTDRELISAYRDKIFTAMASANRYNSGDVAFITRSEFAQAVKRCKEDIAEDSSENAIQSSAPCQFITNAVIKESMKDKCIGLGE